MIKKVNNFPRLPERTTKHVLFEPFRSPFNSAHALQMAKRNVEKYFAVVGVLEDMSTTIKVLEGYIPRFFKQASSFWEGERLDSDVLS